MPLQPGQILGDRYRVVKHLAEGGMGAVYRAWDLRLKIAVALKEMIPLTDQSPDVLAKLRTQFSQEATILAKLNHPNLVRVGDFFHENHNSYLVMDYVDGENLAEIIAKTGAVPEARMLEWTKQLLDALKYCHLNGIVHRDIKPQNVIIRSDGQAILVDFGLVKLWNPADPRTKTVMRGLGTPEYAPPEQYDTQTGHTDPRSDLYSLGACLYHGLTGQAPPTATQRMAGILPFQPPRTINRNISSRTEQVILRAMELKVDSRFPDATSMLDALAGSSARPPPATIVYAPEPTKVMPQSEPTKDAVPQSVEAYRTPISDTRQRPQKHARKWLPWVLGMGGVSIFIAFTIGCWLVSQVINSGPKEIANTETPVNTLPEDLKTSTPVSAAAHQIEHITLNHPNFPNEFGSLDPIRLNTDKVSMQVASDAFVGLTRQDETTLEIDRGMAVVWQVSESGTEWLFHILPGVPWVQYNAGTDQVERVVDENDDIRYVSAHDFIYGLNRILEDPNSNYGYLFYPMLDESSVGSSTEVVDDITFRIKLNASSGYFDVLMDLYISAMPSWSIETHGDLWTTPPYFQGYGPYILKEIVPGESLTVIRNPYWLGTDSIPVPEIDEITWRIIPEDAVIPAFEQGELDRVYVPNSEISSVITSEQYKTLLSSMSNGCIVYYEFNTQKPPFTSPEARLAFSLAINRELIVEIEKRGNEPTMWFSPTDARAGLAMSGMPVPELGYDVSAANVLLDQVYPDRKSIPTIQIAYRTSTGAKGLIATELGRQWKENLNVTVEHLPYIDSSEYYEMLYAEAPHIYRIATCGDFNDAQSYLDLRGATDDLMARSGWYDAVFVSYLEDAAISVDQNERNRLYAEAEEILVKSQAVLIPLRWSRQLVLTQPYLRTVESHLVRVERIEKWSSGE